MSVGTRRLAAAQRTAVRTPTSRRRRLAAWILIVPALSLFSFSVVAGAANAGGKPAVEKAAEKVVPKAPPPPPAKRDDGKPEPGDQKRDGGQDDGVLAQLNDHGKAVCWISRSQLKRVSALYRTTTSSITVKGRTYTLVTVYGADQKALRTLLGASAVQCQLVQVARMFFLPFDPNLS